MASRNADSRTQMLGATIFLRQSQPIDAERFLSATRSVLDGTEPAKMTAGVVGPSIVVTHGDMLTISPMGFSYPGTLRQQAQFAHFWPTALQDIAACADHMMVHCKWSKFSRVEAHFRHLVVVEALVKQLPAAGVLWGSALTPTHTFLQLAGNIKNGAPTQLWVLAQFSRQPSGNALVSTIGMRDLGLMEVETDSPVPVNVAYNAVLKIASAAITARKNPRPKTAFDIAEGLKCVTREGRSFRSDVRDRVVWLDFNPPKRQGIIGRLLSGS